MSILVIITGSSSSIITHHQNHNHLFNPKNASLFSLHNHISLSLSKPTSPTPPCSSSSPPPSIPSSSSLLISPSNGDDEPIINDLRYYADIASMLVKDGRFEDFRMVVDTVLSSHKNGVLEFGKLLNLELVMVGIFKGLREKRIKSVVGLLGCFPQLGIDVLGLFDDSAMELLKKEYIHIVKSGNLEVGVQLIETLAGFRFPIRELVKSSEMIKICVDKRSPRLALRYVCLLPHVEILVCTVIREFGKKKDIDSALEVFEASKQKMVGNMYVYRTIIDVCGLCGDCSKSRFIYEMSSSQNKRKRPISEVQDEGESFPPPKCFEDEDINDSEVGQLVKPLLPVRNKEGRTYLDNSRRKAHYWTHFWEYTEEGLANPFSVISF